MSMMIMALTESLQQYYLSAIGITHWRKKAAVEPGQYVKLLAANQAGQSCCWLADISDDLLLQQKEQQLLQAMLFACCVDTPDQQHYQLLPIEQFAIEQADSLILLGQCVAKQFKRIDCTDTESKRIIHSFSLLQLLQQPDLKSQFWQMWNH